MSVQKGLVIITIYLNISGPCIHPRLTQWHIAGINTTVSAVRTRSHEFTNLGIKWSKYTHFKPNNIIHTHNRKIDRSDTI